MPIYEYRCDTCGHVFDKFVRSMSTTFDVECPQCHGKSCHKNITRFGTNAGASIASSAACAPSG